MTTDRLIPDFQQKLEELAVPKSKTWWEKYMGGVIPFRGVGIPENRKLLETWRNEKGIADWSQNDQLQLALDFIKEPVAEDKLAGILYIQNYLYKSVPWQTAIEKFDIIFENQWIFDWNICDWFCVRILGPMIKEFGLDCATAIAAWQDADYLWKARCSVVPFTLVAENTKYHELMNAACTSLIKRPERFAKTAVGWFMREVSKHDQKYCLEFVNHNIGDFSKESLKNALKYFDKEIKTKYQQHQQFSI